MTTRMSYGALGVAMALTLTGQSLSAREAAPDMTVVIQRLEDGTEMYVSAAAPTLFDLFDTDSSAVPMRGDFIDFDAFFGGTWDIGDALLSQAHVTIDGTDAGFEAMSFMLHPQTEQLPLRTRIDGMIAIGVCNTVEPGAELLLEDMQAYVGYYAHRGSDAVPIEITLPDTDHAALSLQVYDITPSGFVHEYTLPVASGERVSLELPAQPVALARLGVGFLGVIGAIALAIAFLPRVAARLRRIS